MGLPLDYAARNLTRRWSRTALTSGSAALVAALLVATTAFVRGMGGTFSGAARPDVALLLSTAAEGDVLRSTVGAGLDTLVRADVPGVRTASSEIHMGTTVRLPGIERDLAGFVRGVTSEAYAVHDAVTLVEGRLPRVGEVLVGRLVERQLGVPDGTLQVGGLVHLEGADLRVSGRFVAPGTTLEAELWTPLEPLRGLTQRDDSSVVFVRLEDAADLPHLALFAKRRLDLEITMVPSAVYYASLAAYFAPIRALAWALAALIGLAALTGGANTMAAAVQDRVRELATLRAVGYGAGAVARSLALESLLLCAAGGVGGLVLARLLLGGSAVRLAMSAFELRVDAASVLVGMGGVLLLGLLGALPAAVRALRLPVAAALKED